MKITEDFIGNETKTLTKTKISTILRWWGFNPDSYSTWGNARSDMNNILSGTPTGEISDRERASTFLSKINYVNDTDAIIGDTIFAAGVPGVWYDPSDLSTLFQDSAGTAPVTAVEQPVGLMLDKSGRGNHASQATTTARPILSARYNILPNTVFAGAVSGTVATSVQPTGWSKVFWTGGSIAVDNSAGDGAITFSTTLGQMVIGYPFSVTAGQVYVCSVDIEVLSGSYNPPSVIDFTGVGTGAVKQYFFNGEPIGSENIPSSGRLVCVVTVGSDTSTTTFRLGSGANAPRTGVIKVSRPDVRLSADSSILPGYQRVVSPSEYSTEGFPYYLRFDGVDDHLSIPSLDFSGASSAAAVIGVQKLSDAIASRPYSHGISTGQNGAFRFLAPANGGQASVRAASRGADGVLRETAGPNDKAAPITLVLCSTYGANAPVSLRYNGTESRVSAGSLGALTLPSARSVIGALVMGATTQSIFFLGRIYGLAHIARALSPVEQRILEQFIRNKSKAY